ncbi:MAG: DUF885 family protein [Acidobacteria bacterium]|nr:MAG: DUF885 family protein [Acidobacteriota bacterium]REK05390.1 MAG: DUF885 family protein [Acidobacteriota bacterium]
MVELFAEWRGFERPALRDGAPDYTAEAMRRKSEELPEWQRRLGAIDSSGWGIAEQIDHRLVAAEMNGLRFYLDVLRPWARDPAFYQSVWTAQSDTPAHEGPTHHALVELWTYGFPLSDEAAARLEAELATIPPLLDQARVNLVGDAEELWLSGIGTLRDQSRALRELAARVADAPAVEAARSAALAATDELVAWLEAEAPKKTAASGVGEEAYTWSLRNVHLVPMSWADEEALLRRELDRAWSSLVLEEQRNRDLPELQAAGSPEEYDRRAQQAVTDYLDFLRDREVLVVREYMDPALRAQVGGFVPLESRNFFRIAMHYDVTTLLTHFYHWWDLARMEVDPHPSPIRRGPLLFNIWDSRSEGLSTGVEEMFLHAGLYDDRPRVREIVWILLAQRAARGLGSLYVHANRMTMKEARDFHVRWTPRGWMREDLDLLGFEQQLYLRQPGYGTSYITGKYLVERLLREVTEQRQRGEEEFSLASFFAELDAEGVIPVSLIHWQMTGDDSMVPPLPAGPPPPLGR